MPQVGMSGHPLAAVFHFLPFVPDYLVASVRVDQPFHFAVWRSDVPADRFVERSARRKDKLFLSHEVRLEMSLVLVEVIDILPDKTLEDPIDQLSRKPISFPD
jgi:hypothetical protein